MSKITNLIGTTWRLPCKTTGLATEYGEFNVEAKMIGAGEYYGSVIAIEFDVHKFCLGYKAISSELSSQVDTWAVYADAELTVDGSNEENVSGYLWPEEYTTFNIFDYEVVFTGGDDISNPLFIDFINTYGTLVSGGEPQVTITYNENVIASLGAGQSATLQCNGKKMVSDVIVAAPEVTDSPSPIEVATETEMTTLLSMAEVGAIYKYTGETTDTYENGTLYVVEGEVVIKTLTYAQTSTWSSQVITRDYEEGMTWAQFINSEYNIEQTNVDVTGTFILNSDNTVSFSGSNGSNMQTIPVYTPHEGASIRSSKVVGSDIIIESPYASTEYYGGGSGN